MQSSRHLRDILKACDEQVVTSEADSEKAYRIRSESMVDRSDYVLAVYDNDRSIRSGIGMTVNYACKRNFPVVPIHPNTGAITEIGD